MSFAVHPGGQARRGLQRHGGGRGLRRDNPETTSRRRCTGMGRGSFSAVSLGPQRGAALCRRRIAPELNHDLAERRPGQARRSAAVARHNRATSLCGDGIAAGAVDPTFGLIAPNGEQALLAGACHLPICGASSGDGFGVVWQMVTVSASDWVLGARYPVQFDLATFRLSDAP